MDMELRLKIKKISESSRSIKVNKDREPLFESTETDTLYILVGYLSGFKKENVAILIDAGGHFITISGVKYIEEMVLGKWGMYKKNVQPRRFHKVFRIPDNVDIDMINARFYEEEILRVFMPKTKPGEFSGIPIQEVDDKVSDQGAQDVTIETARNEETGESMDDDHDTEAVENSATEERNTDYSSDDKTEKAEEEQSEFAPTETDASELNVEEAEDIEIDEAQESGKQVKDSTPHEETLEHQNHPTNPGENHKDDDRNQITNSAMDGENQRDGLEETPIRNPSHDTQAIENETFASKEAPVKKQRETTTDSKRFKDHREEHDHNLDDHPNKVPRISPMPIEDQEIPQDILRKDHQMPDSRSSKAPPSEQDRPDLPKPFSKQTDKYENESKAEIPEKERNHEIQQPESDNENKIQTTEEVAGQGTSNTEISEDSKDGRHEQRRRRAKDESTQTPAWPRRRCLLCSPWLYVGSTLVALVMVVVVHLSRKRK